MFIGLTGYAGSGKDTVAEYLIEKYGFVRLAFADKVRDLALALDPYISHTQSNLWGEVYQHGWDVTKQIPEVREYLQNLGTSCREIQGDGVWIEALEQEHWGLIDDATVNPATAYSTHVVVTDVRFQNEAQWIENTGGVVVRVSRETNGPVNEHISETAMDDWEVNHTINNNGTIEELHNQIDNVMRGI